ncbi:conjugative transposon protein TraM [Flavisolibacter nicotianae]|uniref:conjugative transposon protein TraM n=1 Tax=Flavisolibacter nicotianae TaxID=2364882 RepID=UPI000EB3D97B|nr:conjugative transposon protein TraM [Flavisolibacter nicotianae]
METTLHSPLFLRKRKFFLFFPLLVLPFTTLLFLALGGGRGGEAGASQREAKGALNMQLPDANLKEDQSLTKLSYYEKAASDSQKLEEQLKNDPYYLGHGGTLTGGLHQTSDTGFFSRKGKQIGLHTNTGLNTSPYNPSAFSDPNEARVYAKLNELNRAMSAPTVQSNRTNDYSTISRRNSTSVGGADIDRLEQLMDRARNGDHEEDPEMKQLNGMMDKILAIQHPERIKASTAQTANEHKGEVFTVSAGGHSDYTSLLQSGKHGTERDTSNGNDFAANGFFSLEDEPDNSSKQANAIQAVVHETGSVVEGATIKLRLQTDVLVNGTLIPKGSFVFGTALLNGERLNIRTSSLRYQSSLFPVQLSVFDLDGLEGVYVPGAITRDVAKNSADRAIQSIGMNTLNPSIGAQATTAGIDAAKTLLSRKAKLVKVTLKAGYRVLLRDEKQTTSF